MKALKSMVLPVVMVGIMCTMASCTASRYEAKSNEEIYGTWINEKEGKQRIVIFPGGTGQVFIYRSDATPWEKLTYRFYRKWKDTGGNVLYTTDYTVSVGSASQNMQKLERISRDGSVWEYVFEYVGEFSPEKYPTSLDPDDPSYHIYFRSLED